MEKFYGAWQGLKWFTSKTQINNTVSLKTVKVNLFSSRVIASLVGLFNSQLSSYLLYQD